MVCSLGSIYCDSPQLLRQIWCMIFQEKYFSFYMLLTDQTSLPCFINLNMTSQILKLTLSFDLFNHVSFFHMTKKSKQKFKYLQNKTIFQGEIKDIFLSFLKGFQLPKIRPEFLKEKKSIADPSVPNASRFLVKRLVVLA